MRSRTHMNKAVGIQGKLQNHREESQDTVRVLSVIVYRAIRIRIRINRAMRTAREECQTHKPCEECQTHKPCDSQRPVFPPVLPVGSQGTLTGFFKRGF